MQDEDKSKEQLIAELQELRKRVAESEQDKEYLKRAEQAMQESQQMLQSILDNIPVRVFWKDNDSNFLGCNRPFALDAGLQSPEEIKGKNDFAMGWADQADVYRSDDRWVMETGIPKLGYEEIQTTPDGGRIWLRTNKVPLLDADGRVRGVLGTYENISESKRMEEKLRTSESMYRIVADNTYDWEYWVSPEGRFIYTSPSCRRVTGYMASELEIDPNLFIHIIHPDDLDQVEGYLVPTQFTAGPCELEFRIIHRDGTTRWIGHVSQPVYDAAGGFLGRRGSNRDITDSKRVENELRESQTLLSTIIESIPFEFWAMGKDGRYMLLNSVGVHNYGNIIGRKPEDFCEDQRTLSIWQSNNSKAFEGELVKADVKFIFGGVERFYHTIIAPIRAGDQIRGILGVNIDIAERKVMEERLRKSRDDLELRVQERTVALEKANLELRLMPSKLIAVQEEERKRLASELHDSIGQTLAAVKFWVEMALQFRDEGNDTLALDHLERFVPILQRSIEETRNIYMGLRPPMLEDMGLLATLEWLRGENMKLYPQHHIEFETGVTEDEIPESLKVCIFRIAQEALNNVAKHSKAEWVDISLSKNIDGIELAVSDDGVGMNLEQTLQSSTTRSLGFSSMRERAEITGGNFSIESAPGKGTTIRVCWPI